MHDTSVFKYTNPHLINRYKKDYPNNRLSAEEALSSLMQYFWISHQHKQEKKKNPDDVRLQFSCAMYKEMQEIDDMWHIFLLFTQDYMDFCYRYFGEYVHHTPTIEIEKPMPEKYETELTRYLSYLYDHLGEETVRQWFL